jgi:beta-galactosidase/beta-glucuronidase
MGGNTAGIALDGRDLLVDGKPFRIRGVNWNPVAKGKTHPAGLDFAGFADRDIPLMRAAGINVVRTYEPLQSRAVLDKLQAAGIRVFSTVYGWWEDEPSIASDRVNVTKDHPAILAWVIGNEWNYNRLYSQGSKEPPLTVAETRARLNSAAAAIKAADGQHPISTIYGELDGLAETIQSMPDIDIWGVNAYRGISFGDLFQRFAALSTKPLYLGEYGADAYDSRGAGKVDLMTQAEATTQLTQELIDHYVGKSGGVTLGGFVFEWADEWWKAGMPDTQEVGGVAPGGGPYPDATFNEEYWGLVDIDRNARPAYDALKALYAK